jgi:hypothetical protein
MTRKSHQAYLKITSVVIGSFGPVFFLGAVPGCAEPARWTLDFLSWPLDGMQNYDAATTRFLSALTGGFLFGWGVCVWMLQKFAYPIAPEAIRKSVVIGVLSWFVLDSSGSALSGNLSNVWFNIAVLLLAVGPLWWPAEEDRL